MNKLKQKFFQRKLLKQKSMAVIAADKAFNIITKTDGSYITFEGVRISLIEDNETLIPRLKKLREYYIENYPDINKSF